MAYGMLDGDEDTTLWMIAGASYFASLALIAALYPLYVFPYFMTSAPSRGLAVVCAALSAALIAYIRSGFRVPGNIAAGLIGALAGIGALFLPTVSALISLTNMLLPLAFLFSQLLLISLADCDCRRLGGVSSFCEDAITVVFGLMVMAPTLCLLLARS